MPQGCVHRRLLAAVQDVDFAGVRQALAEGADPNAHPEYCPGAVLFCAAMDGPRELVELLLRHGARWEAMHPVRREELLASATKHRDPWLPDLIRAFIPATAP